MTPALARTSESPWIALRSARFRLLVGGSLCSTVGDYFYAVALPWYVLSGHGSPALLGTVLAAYGIPRVLLISAGGYLCDRIGPWTIMFTAGAGRAALVALLAFAAAVSRPSAWMLVPLAACIGAGEGLVLPAYFSAVPALLGPGELQSGNALLSLANQSAALAGPALGGAVVAFTGPVAGFSADAASFAISAVTIWGIKARSARGDRHQARASDRPSLRTFLRREPIVPLLVLTTFIANLGAGGLSEVALPVFARSTIHQGATTYGLLISCFAAGAVTGSISTTRLPPHWRSAVAIASAFLLEGGIFAGLAFTTTLAVAAALLTGAGLCNGFANVTQITLFQHWSPPELIGRMSSVLLTASFGSYPLSVALAGLVVSRFAPRGFLLAAGVSLLLTEAAALSQSTWRDWGKSSPEAAS